MPFQEQLLDFMREKAYKPLTQAELVSPLNLEQGEVVMLVKVQGLYGKEGLVVKNRRGR